jgi:hypothetical protein
MNLVLEILNLEIPILKIYLQESGGIMRRGNAGRLHFQ